MGKPKRRKGKNDQPCYEGEGKVRWREVFMENKGGQRGGSYPEQLPD